MINLIKGSEQKKRFNPSTLVKLPLYNNSLKSKNINVNSKLFNLAILSISSAMAVVLSIFESFIPALPFLPPGARIGISNVVNMAVAGSIGVVPAVTVGVLKSLFVGVTRGLIPLVMSFSGTVLSTIMTGLMIKTKRPAFGYMGIGIIGAITHNMSQLAVAYFLTQSPVIYYVPYLFLLSIVFGSITGIMLGMILPIIKKIVSKDIYRGGL